MIVGKKDLANVKEELTKKHQEDLETREEALKELRQKATVLESERDKIAREFSTVYTKAQDELRRAQAAHRDEATKLRLANRELKEKVETFQGASGIEEHNLDFETMDEEEVESKMRAASVRDDQCLSHYIPVNIPETMSFRELRETFESEYPGRKFDMQGPKHYVEDGINMLHYRVILREQATAMSRVIENRINFRIAAKADPQSYPEKLRGKSCLSSIPEGAATGSGELPRVPLHGDAGISVHSKSSAKGEDESHVPTEVASSDDESMKSGMSGSKTAEPSGPPIYREVLPMAAATGPQVQMMTMIADIRESLDSRDTKRAYDAEFERVLETLRVTAMDVFPEEEDIRESGLYGIRHHVIGHILREYVEMYESQGEGRS